MSAARSAQRLLFGPSAADLAVVDARTAGTVVRRAWRVQGRNAAGELVAARCDRAGKDLRPEVVELVDEAHSFPAVSR